MATSNPPPIGQFQPDLHRSAASTGSLPFAGNSSAVATDPTGSRAPGDVSLYVHVPFCRHRCGYCAFVLEPERADSAARYVAYSARVQAEARHWASVVPADTPLRSVYFGGGTPSLLSPALLREILTTIDDGFGLSTVTETTIEANPESLTAEYVEHLVNLGFTRVSIGLQSTSPSVLAALDRPHSPTAALRAVRRCVKAGLSVSVDVMGATPNETNEDVTRTIGQVIESGAHHVSMYLLSVEPGTKLAAHVRDGTTMVPEDAAAAERYQLAEHLLATSGYGWYEVSNWALTPGHQSVHNLRYWRDRNWIGLGPGAHSHWDDQRWWNTTKVDRYLAGTRISGGEILTLPDRSRERIMLGVRLAEGLSLGSLQPTQRLLTALEDLERSQLITTHPDPPGTAQNASADQTSPRVQLTLQGRLVVNSVIRSLWDATEDAFA